MEDYVNGLLGVGEKDTDYIFGSGPADVKKLLKGRDDNGVPIYEYNQGAQRATRYYCTIYSAVTELSDLFKREFSLSEILEIGRRMERDGKMNPNKGAYLSDAIDYTRKWWNENFPQNTVSSYRIDYRDKELRRILTHEVPRLVQLGYRTSSEMNKDIQENGYTMEKDFPKKGGHAVSMYGLNIIDNYKGKKKFNRYSFHYFDDLLKNGVIFRYGYLFLKDDPNKNLDSEREEEALRVVNNIVKALSNKKGNA